MFMYGCGTPGPTGIPTDLAPPGGCCGSCAWGGSSGESTLHRTLARDVHDAKKILKNGLDRSLTCLVPERHYRCYVVRARSNRPWMCQLTCTETCRTSGTGVEEAYLNQVLSFGLRDERLQFRRGESVYKTGLGDDQQEDLSPCED